MKSNFERLIVVILVNYSVNELHFICDKFYFPMKYNHLMICFICFLSSVLLNTSTRSGSAVASFSSVKRFKKDSIDFIDRSEI